MDIHVLKQRLEILPWHSVFLLTSTYLITILYIGLTFSFGTIFTDIMTTFNSTRAETAVIQSAFISVYMLSGVVAGILTKKFGSVRIGICGSLLFSISLMACFFASNITFLIICAGLLNGFGLSCVNICATNVTSHQFSGKRQLLYMSMFLTSCGIGGTIYPYLLGYLRDLYGWRGALLIIGALCLNAVPICILWKTPLYSSNGSILEYNSVQIADFQSNMQVKTDVDGQNIVIAKTDRTDIQVAGSIFVIKFPVLMGETTTNVVTVNEIKHKISNTFSRKNTIGMHIKSILCNRCFMLVVFGTVLASPSSYVSFTFVGDIYYDNGLANDDVSFGLFLLNIFNIIARLLLGIVLHFKFVPVLLVPLLCSLVSAVLFLILPFVKSRSLLLAWSALSGIPVGMSVSMFAVLTLKLIGSNLYPIAAGIFFTLTGIGNLVFGPLNGFLRDVTDSYTTTFFTGAAVQLVAAFIYFLAYITRRNNKNKLRKHSTVFYLTNF